MSKKTWPHPTRRELLGASLYLPALVAWPGLAGAQSAWPNKPVMLVVPYPPGGQTDFAARLINPGMASTLGQPIVVDNKPGANGNIATAEMLRTPADGYKLLVGNSNMTINPHTFPTPSPDPLKLVPIGLILQSSLVLCVNNDVPARTFQEFVAYANERRKDDGLLYASGGSGSISQATMELVRDRIGRPRMTHVPYKGSGPAITDLIGGHVQAMFDGASVVAPYVKSGKTRPLLTTGTTRVAAMPDVPTATELGLRDIVVYGFVGLYGPPGLPAEIAARANAALNAALKDENVRKSVTDLGDEPGGGSMDRLAAMTRDSLNRWGEVAKISNIKTS